MSKSSLRKKVLCSLLAASVFGVMYNPGAEAAKVNGHDLNDLTAIEKTEDGAFIITNESFGKTEDGKIDSKKFIFGQGDKIIIATDNNVNTLIADLKAAGKDTDAIRAALANNAIVGVIGGEGQLDSGLTGLFNNKFDKNLFTGIPAISGNNIKSILGTMKSVESYEKLANQASDLINKIEAINTAQEDHKVIGSETDRKETNIVIGTDEASPVVIGAVGGDLSVNTGLQGNIKVSGKVKIFGNRETTLTFGENANEDGVIETSITRYGNVNMAVNNGNVLGGVGGSAAIAMGNMDIHYVNTVGNVSFGETNVAEDVKMTADLTMDGKTTTTINGNVKLGINGGSNVAGFAGGGLAMGMGGEATSTVDGNVTITVDSDVDLKNGKFDGITAGITGGGAAVTTFGGTADTKVGTVNINIDNGLSAGIIGGGVATAVDATGVAEGVLAPDKQLGNDAGYVDINKAQLEALLKQTIPGDKLDITISNAIQGGEATSVTGDTNIELTGTSSAAGVVGGGVAISSHTYTWKGDGTADGNYKVNDSFGYSKAVAESGKTTITINVDSSKMTGEQKSNVINALKALKDTTDLTAVNEALAEIQGTGAVVGIVGGGVAVAQGSNRSNMEGTSGNWGENGQGAYSNATNDGAQINLVNGYAVGTFGGGMAIADNNAKADAETLGDITINIGNGTEAVGVFGNGLAYFTGSQKTAEGKDANLAGSANVVAQNTAINVGVDFTDYTGTDKTTTVDGIIGGGVAIDDSQADKVNATVRTEGTAAINVFDGAEVNVMNYDPLKSLAGKPVGTNGDGTPIVPGELGNNPPDMGSYVYALEAVAGNIAITGGGITVGGGADAYVKNAVINIAGGTVNGDILGGGIAVYGYGDEGGSKVDNVEMNLTGGKVDGNIYAGGAALNHDYTGRDYDKATSTVGEATINLAGTEVTGIISGAGYYIDDVEYNANDKVTNIPGEKHYDYSVDSTLNLIGENTLTAVAGESKISGFDTVNFGENSMTILKPVAEGTVDDNTIFIDGTMGGIANPTTITVADSARLDVNALQGNGDKYIIAKNFEDNSQLWGNEQLAYDRTEGYITTETKVDAGNNNIYELVYKDIDKLSPDQLEQAVDDAVNSFGKFGGNARGIIEGIMTDKENSNQGAVDMITDMFKGSKAEAEQGLYTGMMIGEDSGVTSNAVSMAQDFADNSSLRLSFTQDTVNADKVGEEGSVWAKYLHNKHEVNGMNSSFGALNSSSSYDGVMVGAELAKKGNMQAGIAFAYGEGDGNGLTTKNDFDMWGISLYGNVKNDDVNIIGDLGFSKSSNEITGKVLDSAYNTDRDLNIFTMGVRAEKLIIVNKNNQIVPYAGLRYMSVDADSYSTAYNGGEAFDYDADRQDIWTLPVGVSFRNETVNDNGWTVTPKVDIAYIWAFGDTDNNVTVNAGSGESVLSYDVMDSGSWLTSVGIDATKGDWTYGVNYSFQKGNDVENNKWFVNVNYSF